MNIIIVTGRSRHIGNFYDNLINPIKGYFDDKNIKYKTIHFADEVRNDNDDNNLYIGIFHHVDLNNMPKNYIMLAISLKTENISSSVSIFIGSEAEDILTIVNSFFGLIHIFCP